MLTESEFLILDAIDRHQPGSQRALAHLSGMSLGKTNYVLRKLAARRLVKISNFKGNTRKRKYLYLLTPKGLEARARVTISFIKARINEFEQFRDRLLENLLALQEQGVNRLMVVGPENLCKFLAHLTWTENVDIDIVGTLDDPESMDCLDQDSHILSEKISRSHSRKTRHFRNINSLHSGSHAIRPQLLVKREL
ncbi:MAG: hypothetical protein ACLFVT_03775 [Syntrophobacteria bacterium]